MKTVSRSLINDLRNLENRRARTSRMYLTLPRHKHEIVDYTQITCTLSENDAYTYFADYFCMYGENEYPVISISKRIPLLVSVNGVEDVLRSQ